MAATLFVDNLPSQLMQSELELFFAPFHPLRVLLATHRSGRCLGFGFVMFPTEQEADEAVRSLSGVQLNGCSIRLSKRITADVEAEAV
jgi:RNA recognition motif-containing protein